VLTSASAILVAADVQRSGRDARRCLVHCKPLRESLRMDGMAERVEEHQVEVAVGVPGEAPLEELRLAVLGSISTVSSSSAIVRNDRLVLGRAEVLLAELGRIAK
jgi:hypothetical protein